MLIGISAIIAAVAFVVLVYYLVETLKSLKQSLDEMRGVMTEVKADISTIAVEVKDVVHQTNQMTSNVRTKLNALDSLFDSVNDIGQIARELSQTVKQTAVTAIRSFKRRKEDKALMQREAAVSAETTTAAGSRTGRPASVLWNGLSLALRLLENYAAQAGERGRTGTAKSNSFTN